MYNEMPTHGNENVIVQNISKKFYIGPKKKKIDIFLFIIIFP